MEASPQRPRPTVVHLTTVDMSLRYLLLPQLRAFVDAGYDVYGVSAPGPYAEDLRGAGITPLPLPSSTRSLDVGSDLRAAAEFRAVVRRLRPDIVHTHNPKPGVYGRIVARTAGVPVVVNTVHGLYAQPSDPLRRRAVVYGLERMAAAFSDAELVQSREDLELLRRLRIPGDRLHLLGNGIDLERFRPDDDGAMRERVRRELGFGPNDVVFGLVGRLVAEKGYREAFRAMADVSRRCPDARFVVIGPHEPDKADALAPSALERIQQAAPVRFFGMRDDVERLYTAMDVYVLASHREGFPRSAMEAAAMGLPLLLTDIRGCREVVDHDENGWLVPVRDASALADAMVRLATDADLRRRFGRRSRLKALREFDVRRQVEVTLDVYESLLSRRAGGRP